MTRKLGNSELSNLRKHELAQMVVDLCKRVESQAMEIARLRAAVTEIEKAIAGRNQRITLMSDAYYNGDDEEQHSMAENLNHEIIFTHGLESALRVMQAKA